MSSRFRKMKISQSQLRRIINEEMARLSEEDEFVPIGTSRIDSIKKAESAIEDLMRSKDPVVNKFGFIAYYAMLTALAKTPGTAQSRTGDIQSYKQMIDESLQSLMSIK